MNHTKNYNLPQWELNDLIRMEDFNSMNASIENGLTSSTATAGAARDEAAQAKFLAQKLAMNAFTPDNLPYKVGRYVGAGSAQDIEVGFRPSFLIVAWNQVSGGLTPTCHIMVTDPVTVSDRISFTDTGFHLRDTSLFSQVNPLINGQDVKYCYIAFK